MKQSQKARAFAAKAHAGQLYGPNEPYTVHLDDVAALVGADDTAKTVAYLHDVVEDTEVTLQEVENQFGRFVAQNVALLSDEPGESRKNRKAATHAKLAKVQPSHHLALLVKAADRLANLEAGVKKKNARLLQMYRREQAAFREAAYRPGLCDHLWRRIEKILESSDVHL